MSAHTEAVEAAVSAYGEGGYGHKHRMNKAITAYHHRLREAGYVVTKVPEFRRLATDGAGLDVCCPRQTSGWNAARAEMLANAVEVPDPIATPPGDAPTPQRKSASELIGRPTPAEQLTPAPPEEPAKEPAGPAKIITRRAPSAAYAAGAEEMRERAAREVDCGRPGRETLLNVTANGTSQTNSALRWTACGRDPCGALDAAAIRALPLPEETSDADV